MLLSDHPDTVSAPDCGYFGAQGWSLNPGRYVGVTERAADDFEFAVRLEDLNEELESLNVEATELEDRIAENVTRLLEVVNGWLLTGWQISAIDSVTLTTKASAR
jgi:type I restriction enzyme M protein